MATNGYLSVTANQLHRQPRYHQGRDLRQKPYVLFRIPVGSQQELLRKRAWFLVPRVTLLRMPVVETVMGAALLGVVLAEIFLMVLYARSGTSPSSGRDDY